MTQTIIFRYKSHFNDFYEYFGKHHKQELAFNIIIYSKEMKAEAHMVV